MFVEGFKCFGRRPDMECSTQTLLEEATELGQTLASLFLSYLLRLQAPQRCFGVHKWEAPHTFHSESWCMTYMLAAQVDTGMLIMIRFFSIFIQSSILFNL